MQSVSFLVRFGREFQLWGPRHLRLLFLYLIVWFSITSKLRGLCVVKVVLWNISFMYPSSTWHTIKTNCKTSDYWPRDWSILIFYKKIWEYSLSTTFCVWFLRKMFLLTYSITWLNFVVWLSLLLEMLGNMCIAIVCFPGCDVINFGINYIFLIKPFFYMTKKSSKLKSILTKLTRWYLCKSDAQVDIYLKLQLIKSNPVVFLLVTKD